MSLTQLLIAFSGGILGTLFGGTIAFIFSGFLAFLGILIVFTTGNTFVVNDLAFGPLFGPQSTFIGGVAAAAWIGRTQHHPTLGSDVVQPLFFKKDPYSLLFGGIFGVIGFSLSQLLKQNMMPIDAVAFSVVFCAILTRLFIGREKIFQSKQPLTLGESYSKITHDIVWVLFLSIGIGYICQELHTPLFGWSMSAISMIFIYTNNKDIPVTHHITMTAGYAMMAFNNLFIAGIAGTIAFLLGVIFEEKTNNNVATHFDMPATIIALLSIPIFIFQMF